VSNYPYSEPPKQPFGINTKLYLVGYLRGKVAYFQLVWPSPIFDEKGARTMQMFCDANQRRALNEALDKAAAKSPLKDDNGNSFERIEFNTACEWRDSVKIGELDHRQPD